jgi:hypothetical protein
MPPPFPDWIIGVILMLAGTFMNNLGNNLMSLGHCEIRDLEKLRSKTVSSFASDKSTQTFHEKEKKGNWWFTGTVIFVIGALVTFISFGFAPQSLLASLESAQFLSNVVFMKYMHGISVSRKVMLSTSSILVGNILVVIFASHATDRLNTHQIVQTYKHNIGYQLFLGLSSIVFFISYFISEKYAKSRLAGVRLYEHDLIEPIAFITYSALIGSQVVLHSKNLSMIVFECFGGSNQFETADSFIIWIELAIWITSAVVYVNRINRGLDNYPPAFFIPVLAVAFALGTIISGGLFFYEFVGYSLAQTICFSLGVVLICCGVVGLSGGPQCHMNSLPPTGGCASNPGAVHPIIISDASLATAASCNDSGNFDEKCNSQEQEIMKMSPRVSACASICEEEKIVAMAGMIAPKRRRSFDNSQYDFALQLMHSRDKQIALERSSQQHPSQPHQRHGSVFTGSDEKCNSVFRHSILRHSLGSALPHGESKSRNGSGVVQIEFTPLHQLIVTDFEAQSHDPHEDELIPDILVLKSSNKTKTASIKTSSIKYRTVAREAAASKNNTEPDMPDV